MLWKIHKFIFERPLAAAAGLGLFAALCAAAACGAKFNQSVSDILPLKDAAISDYETVLSKFDLSNSLYFLLRADDKNADIAALAKKFSESLSGLPRAKKSAFAMAGADIKKSAGLALDFAPAVFTEADELAAREAVKTQNISSRLKKIRRELLIAGFSAGAQTLEADPFGLLEIFRKKLPNPPETVFKESGRALVAASFDADAKDSAQSAEIAQAALALAKNFERGNPGVKVAVSGSYRISADNAKIASEDSARSLAASLILIAAIVCAAFRRKIFALMAALPAAAGILAAFAATAMAFKSVSAIAVAFASIAAGVSIDYALHIIFECSKDGASDLKKVSGIARRLSRPVAIAALTTLAAFVFVGISGSEGFGQMGVFGGVSIIVCAAASIALLPPIIAKFGADKLGKSLIERLSDKLSKALSRHSRLCLAAFFAVCLASIFALPMLEFDGKISSFSGVSKSAGQDAELVRKSCASLVSKTAFAVGANDFFEAANANERLLETLKKTEGASEIASLAPLFPNKISRAQNIERWRKFFAPENLEKYSESLKKACSENGFKFGNFSPALARLSKEPNTNSALQEMRGDPLFSAIFDAVKIDENGETFFLTTASLSNACDKSALQKSLPQGALMADGETFQNRVSELARIWILRFIILCPALIFAFLAIAFKSVFRAFIIMVPVLGGLLASFAAMAVLGVKISLVNAVFVIFAVCLAQDYSVFFACERGGGESSKALPAVLASALTTIAGFGALAFARHPVLRGLGESAAISIFSIFTMSILFRGAASKFLRPRAESPAPKTPWRGKSHGGYFGHLCFTFLIRRFGLKPAYALLFFVAIYFAFFKRGVFRQSANYIRAAQGERGIIKLPLKVFRHIYSFGAVLIEKWACVSGYGGVAVENPDAEKIAAALSEGAGLVAVSAHFGAWELAGETLKKEFDRPVKILGEQREDKKIQKVLDAERRSQKIEFIGGADDKMSFLDAFLFLKKGGILAVQGDRFAGGKFESVEFFSRRAKFPINAFLLAEKSGSKAVQTVCERIAPRRYQIKLLNVFEFPKGSLKNPENSLKAAERFAAALEAEVKKYPYQWFNFYDFWR